MRLTLLLCCWSLRRGRVCSEVVQHFIRLMMRLTLLLCCWSCAALTLHTEANPIRKVVTLLQDMQKEIEAEGDKEQDLYDKFMCYCDGNTDGMSKAAEEAAQKIT